MNTPNTVIEISWEVLNKVGGIHTVIKSKADMLKRKYEEYILVGPLFPEKRNVEFREATPPKHLQEVFSELAKKGITCVYGTWLIQGNPNVVLIDGSKANMDINAMKGLLWENFGVDTLHSGYDYDEPLVWSWAAGMFCEELQHKKEQRIVVQAHEWLAGLCLLYLSLAKSSCATVFTTHATMLGRTICGSTNIPLYHQLETINPSEMAEKLRVSDKHTTERACAHTAHVFSTVSDITAREATYLLAKKPDIILYNGLDFSKYPTPEEASVLHRHAREEIRNFIEYYFYSHYHFDLDNTLLVFTTGRYEYHNKGLDLLTAALGEINRELQSQNSTKTVIALYFIPGDTRGVKMELLEERATFEHMEEYITQNVKQITRTILRNSYRLHELSCKEILSDEIRRAIGEIDHALAHHGNPPLTTHNLPNEEDDAIIKGFLQHNLLNREEDKVKVIRYPIYLSGTDGLLDMTYSEAISGCHLGVFPSYYEPWGYTPVETASLSVPAITTDLAGFGRFISELQPEGGIYVLKRDNVSYEESVEQLVSQLRAFIAMDKYQRNEQKRSAYDIVRKTQWETFIKNYFQAHIQAYEKN